MNTKIKTLFSANVIIIGFIGIMLFSASCSIFRPSVGTSAYSKIIEPFETIDTSPLEGKVIVIDPGHGGTAPGAIGAEGLEEKQVNMQVALLLTQYLKQAKAQVILTRSEDRNMIVEKKDSLRGDDLDYRVRVSTTTQADLFISLHHNSLLPLNRNYNAIETYYKLEDYFSSKDAARFIHKHHVTNLQIPLNFLKPGNYYVLRNNTQTAVLGEASYISNPNIEKRLKTLEAVEIEAKSYFLGIVDYFSRGVPKIESTFPAVDAILSDAQPVFKITAVNDQFGEGIDPHSILIGIDNADIPFTYIPPVISAFPQKPLTNGQHKLFFTAANMKGNHSLLTEIPFIIDAPPAGIHISFSPSSIIPEIKTPIRIEVSVFDKNHNTVRDSTTVLIQVNANPAWEKKAVTKNGIAYAYFPYERGRSLQCTAAAGGIITSRAIPFADQSNAVYILNVTSQILQNQPLENVLVGLNGEQFVYSDPNGFCIFENLTPGFNTFTARLEGYYHREFQRTITSGIPVTEQIQCEPIYAGMLFRKRIVIDPEFGGLQSGAIGPTGLRAADENMETSAYLVQYLRAVGADAQLTINFGEDLTPYSRVRFTNEASAELFVSIRHGSSTDPRNIGIAAYTYPTSSTGKNLSSLIITAFRDVFSLRGNGPIESAEYILQQTGCPAVIVNSGNITNPVMEEDLYGTWRNRWEAYTIFTAIVNFYTKSNFQWGTFSGVVFNENGKAASNALISLDKTITLVTAPDGRFVFTTLEPRRYSVTIQKEGYKTITEDFTIKPTQQIKKNYKLTK